jgi:hypothetical protein
MAYQATYNLSTTFADLNAPMTAPPFGGNTDNDRFPVAGFTGIAGTVSNIETQYSFVLSAGDLASGTSRFNVVVPEPSTFALAAIGVVGLLWRMRRRFV